MLDEASVAAVFVLIAALVVIVFWFWLTPRTCPTKLEKLPDGSYRSGNQLFADMNDFQQWWHANFIHCPLPLLEGKRVVLRPENPREETYAKTPINKVDDYEFSRIFGYERNGRMVEPRQDYTKIITDRAFDWADLPLNTNERKGKYAGLREGFTADGDLRSEAVSRYGETKGDHHCKSSKEEKEVDHMIKKAYSDDPNWIPVVTKVGANHWEVNELIPRRRHGEITETRHDDRVVNTDDDSVEIGFRYREKEVSESAIDPYFSGPPFNSVEQRMDPYDGPVPGMERMFGPTFDHKKWY
jgi:hypothetical protein